MQFASSAFFWATILVFICVKASPTPGIQSSSVSEYDFVEELTDFKPRNLELAQVLPEKDDDAEEKEDKKKEDGGAVYKANDKGDDDAEDKKGDDAEEDMDDDDDESVDLSRRRQRRSNVYDAANPQCQKSSPSSAFSPSSDVSTPQRPAIFDKIAEIEETIQLFLGNETDAIPKIIRGAFHDYILFNNVTNSTGYGCLIDTRIATANNTTVLDAMSYLVTIVKKKHNDTLSIGDIVSLAGKLAVEREIPCLKLAWGFGRPACVPKSVNDTKDLRLNGLISTMSGLRPLLTRFGLSAEKMAILVAGGHGTRNASNRKTSGSGIYPFTMARLSSGKDFLQATFDLRGWLNYRTWFTLRDGNQGKEAGYGRFPVEFMFYPTLMKNYFNRYEPVFEPVETVLTGFLTANRTVFDNRFGQEFSAYFRLGTSGLTEYSEEGQC